MSQGKREHYCSSLGSRKVPKFGTKAKSALSEFLPDLMWCSMTQDGSKLPRGPWCQAAALRGQGQGQGQASLVGGALSGRSWAPCRRAHLGRKGMKGESRRLFGKRPNLREEPGKCVHPSAPAVAAGASSRWQQALAPCFPGALSFPPRDIYSPSGPILRVFFWRILNAGLHALSCSLPSAVVTSSQRGWVLPMVGWQPSFMPGLSLPLNQVRGGKSLSSHWHCTQDNMVFVFQSQHGKGFWNTSFKSSMVLFCWCHTPSRR